MLEDVFHGFGGRIEIAHFVVETVEAAFGAGSIVTGDVENQGVVQLSVFLQGCD